MPGGLNPETLTRITCFNCHRHDQSRADSDHDEVAGYVYDPVRCVACHPAGTA